MQKFLNILKNPVLYASLLGAAFLLSVLIFAFAFDRAERVILFFPNYKDHSIRREVRFFPSQDDLEETIAMTLRELVLGPVKLELFKPFPAGTQINHLILDGARLFVDLSKEAVLPTAEEQLEFDELENLIISAVEKNFKSIEDIVVTVEGQVPNAPYYKR